MKVKLGKLLITSNASCKLAMSDVIDALIRHQSGKWGDIPLSDALWNQEAVETGEGRIMSVYRDSRGTKFWIITEQTSEFPESKSWVTTVLLPSDY